MPGASCHDHGDLPVPDYHVHTRFSDGHDDLEACMRRALELGLPELGDYIATHKVAGIERERQ